MSKAMIVASVISNLLLVVRALLTCGGFPGPLGGGNCPGAGLSGSGNRRYGVFNPSRLATWPAPPRTMPFVQSSAVIPSRPPTLSDTSAWSGPAYTYQTPAKADAWPISRLSISHPAKHHSLSPVGKRRLWDRRRAIPSG